VVCDAPYGPGNVANLRLALDAAKQGVRTYLLERVPIEERDFTAGMATELWAKLRGLAAAISTEEELVDAVRGKRTAR
jgi:iron complex transport system ATP-binding protein